LRPTRSLTLASAARSGILRAVHRSRFVISSASRRPGFNRIKAGVGAFAVLAAVAFGAGGCGRRGALEPPPSPEAVAKADNDTNHPQFHHKPKPVEPPKQPFFLDFLL
jgi:predicted small lipoprotein YifL